MGVLTDVYLAAPDTALSYDESPKSFENVTVSAKGVMDLELSTLWAIYRGVPWDVKMLEEFKQVLVRDGGERIIFQLPDSLANHLADSDDITIRRTALAWAATDEMARHAQYVEPHLQKLVQLAKLGRTSVKKMYLWICV